MSAADKIRLWREKPDVFVQDVFGVTPDAWQLEALREFPRNQRMAFKASKGVGKAHPKSVQFYTPSGKVDWGTIRPGSEVFASDGSIARVRAVYNRGILPVYRVYFDDGSHADCCGDHLWVVRGRDERRYAKTQPLMNEKQRKISQGQRDWNPQMHPDGWVTLSTKEIIERGVRIKSGRWSGRQFEIPQQGAAQFPRNRLPIEPYLMGLWIGDGTRLKPCITTADMEIAQRLKDNGFDVGIKEVKGQGRAKTIAVDGQTDNFRRTGIFELGSSKRLIPEDYKVSCIADRVELLRGLMDSDGCIDAHNGHCEFGTTSKALADDVVYLVRSLGGVSFIKDGVKKPYYYGKNREKICGLPCYRVSVRTPFNPFWIARKAERWKPAKNRSQTRYLSRYIDRIEEIGHDECMCIEVDHPSQCYLINDFIVTHNTALLAWIGWNFLLTRPHPKIAATSISADTLADTLWAEMAHWHSKSPLLRHAFTWTKTRIFANDHPETWWMSARSWPKSADSATLGNTLAGLHADYILFLLDETGGMPEAIMASAEAALASCIEGHIVQAGNPTHLEGPLYRACTTERRLWFVREISGDPDDPMRSTRVSIEWAKDQIEKYGRDNPYVLINVFGQFPPASLNSLIGPDEVSAAMKRFYRPQEYEASARILGIDVAREGLDSTVIFPRQGLQAFPPLQYRNMDGTQGAGLVARKWVDWEADAVFIDNTGGFGSSWIDNLVRLGHSPIGIHFAEKSSSSRYFNKRSEMMFECVEWIKRGGALPEVPELTAALTQTTYTFKGDKMLIEPKDVIKEKLGYSPDHLDSLILSFAMPVQKKVRQPRQSATGHTYVYNPLGRDHVRGDLQSTHTIDYNPLQRR